MPSGTPAVIPTIATVVACQNTISATWRRTSPKPSAGRFPCVGATRSQPAGAPASLRRTGPAQRRGAAGSSLTLRSSLARSGSGAGRPPGVLADVTRESRAPRRTGCGAGQDHTLQTAFSGAPTELADSRVPDGIA
jgi:hypothetical protein